MKDQDGNDLLEPLENGEKQTYEPVWALYRVQNGFRFGTRIGSSTDLISARREAADKGSETPTGSGYHYRVFRVGRLMRQRSSNKRRDYTGR